MWDMRGAPATGTMRGDALMQPSGFDPTRTAPPLTPRDVVRALERARRGRLVRIVSLGVLLPALLLLPGAFSDKGLDLPTLIGVLTALSGAVLAFLINRFQFVSTASYVLLTALLAAIAWDIASKPLSQTGLDLNDLRLYGFFVLPVLLSGVLTGRRGPFIIGGIAIAFTVVSLLVLPRTRELQAYWDGRYADAPGMSYDVVAVPVAILILTAIVAWLGTDSVRRALLGASRADELAAANERILAQAREIELQRRRLQDGIAHMQYVHTAFARGQFDARARVPEGELLPLAISLNQLLDRLQRLAREQEMRVRMEHGVRELAAALRRMRSGEPYVPPNYTGTSLDEVLVELATMRPLGPTPAGPSRPFAPAPPQAPQVPLWSPARHSAARDAFADPNPLSAPPPSPSRAPGWSAPQPTNPPTPPYHPEMAPDVDALGAAEPPADVGGPVEPAAPPDAARAPDSAGPGVLPGSLDPREVLPDWLRGE